VAASLAIAARVVRQCLSAVCAGSPSVLDCRDWRMTPSSLIRVAALDAISDRTRFDLLTNSELRLCHYRIGRFVTMRGPARITISADGFTVTTGKPVEVSQDTCTVAQTSKFQGGLLTRGAVSKELSVSLRISNPSRPMRIGCASEAVMIALNPLGQFCDEGSLPLLMDPSQGCGSRKLRPGWLLGLVP
jgi:hypothetical protein